MSHPLCSVTAWKWKGGDNDLNDSVSLRARGVIFDIERALQTGEVVVKNTEVRIADLTTSKNGRRSGHPPTCNGGSIRWTAPVLSGTALREQRSNSNVATPKKNK